MTSNFLVSVISDVMDELETRAKMHPVGTDEWRTFDDGASALDGVLDLLDELSEAG